MEGDPRRRRESFDAVADLYAAYRPGYPPEVISAVLDAANVVPASRVLEIGCGTGQLSLPIAQAGAVLTAVELGPHLAAIARRRLEPWPDAAVEVAEFETWPLPLAPFDAVLCANAFHWLDPEIRYAKTAQALRAGGALTVLAPHLVRGGSDDFVQQSQTFYRRWGLSDQATFELPTSHDVPPSYPELELRPEFGAVRRLRFETLRPFTTETWVGMLGTDSLVNGLDEASRSGFLSDIAALIEQRLGGVIMRAYLYEVISATRVEEGR